MLRPYQQRCVDDALAWMRTSIDPFVIDAATGSGKSHMIAAIAAHVHKETGKRILVLAPSVELVEQDHEKYVATGAPASIYSAASGQKSLRHPVVFGTPLTVKNRISAFQREGDDGYAMIVIDEAHRVTPTILSIIEAMRGANPRVRVCGLTATPYRLGSGYIFRIWPDGKVNMEGHTTVAPYFKKCISIVPAYELIQQEFLTEPVIGISQAGRYDISGLKMNSRGQFDSTTVDKAYHGKGRLTSDIVADVIRQSVDRKGVMFFAATVRHAHEIMESLPPEISAIVTGENNKVDRRDCLKRFKAGELKYLVNVSVLTTGFDAPHVDVIAILRQTESVSLLQQIIGRGLRISPGKEDCLVLDYTKNIETHCPDGDLFSPVITAQKPGEDTGFLSVTCPDCQYENSFKARPPKDLEGAFGVDDEGYAVDLDNQRIFVPVEENGQILNLPVPAHYGRRCWGMTRVGSMGEYEQCEYRWTVKICPHCDAENDIAARYCSTCKGEIVDPNTKLKIEFKRFKKDPTKAQTDEVLNMFVRAGVSAKGNKTLRVDWQTPYRNFSTWFMPESKIPYQAMLYDGFNNVTTSGAYKPKTISYVKDPKSGFYKILAFNREPDLEIR